MKLTAETITDEQIRALSNTATDGSYTESAAILLVRDCALATLDLRLGYATKHERAAITREQRAARARCAEILNTRNPA